MKIELSSCLEQMSNDGIRRLVILSGEAGWCYEQALALTERYIGDWPWVSDLPLTHYPYLQRKPSAVGNLLGSEFKHAVFDATQGLHVEALAAMAGTLVAGSMLVMMVPDWQHWPELNDMDSLRWSEYSHPIRTPNFIRHLQQKVIADGEVLLFRQHHPYSIEPVISRPPWSRPNGSPTAEQQRLLTDLSLAQQGIYVLIAERGRGKSALAGMLARDWLGAGQCWLTAPAQASTETLRAWSDGKVSFFSPDGLLERCRVTRPEDIDWLIIDEAAAIPAPLLYQLVTFFQRVLLTTTVQGYEGSGRGFLLKFCAGLTAFTRLSLDKPVRWAENDPLERVINQILLMETDNNLTDPAAKLNTISALERQQLVENPHLLNQFYGLLTSAHYRTSPLDLRRLFDAPGMSFFVGLGEDNSVVAGLWLTDEGGLSAELAREVWAGRRRPRGNLVAQSLAAHGTEYLAPQLRSARITRIAVTLPLRRNGIAKALVVEQIHRAKDRGLDYLSVSFGYTDELWLFWQACGFELIHMGSHKEASSGCYSAMALVPFSHQAIGLVKRAKRYFLLNQLVSCVKQHHINSIEPADLGDADWRTLAGFAFALRTLDASQVSIYRLLRHQGVKCIRLRQMLEQQLSLEALIQLAGVSGKKQLLNQWRQEVGEALVLIDEGRCYYWKNWVLAKIPIEDEA